jgi:type IV fimbrial biogenesis protein FimT
MKIKRIHGFSLIELLVGIAILGTLTSMALPGFRSMIQNSRVRSLSESINSGLQLARAEAVRRNKQVRFQLMSSVDNTCAFSTNSALWVISINDTNGGDPTGKCSSVPSDTIAPYIFQVSDTSSINSGIVISAAQSAVAFNGLGQLVSVTNANNTLTGTAAYSINVPDTTTVSCAPTGTSRCLQVQVGSNGQVRMCDSAFSKANDPQGC